MLARRNLPVERRSVVAAYASSVLLFQVTSHCRDESGCFPIVIARAREAKVPPAGGRSSFRRKSVAR